MFLRAFLRSDLFSHLNTVFPKREGKYGKRRRRRVWENLECVQWNSEQSSHSD